MSTFYYNQHQHHLANPHIATHNHHGRSRRAPRISASQSTNRHFQRAKPVKEVVITEAPNLVAFRARFEAGRGFDLDDDLEFCPNLLSFDERQSVASGSSDRSSLSSGSPEHSPLQQQIQPQHITPTLSVSSATTPAYTSPPTFNANTSNFNLKIQQPNPLRLRNNAAIPIVNPSTGIRIASPPSSISPGIMQQKTAVRRW